MICGFPHWKRSLPVAFAICGAAALASAQGMKRGQPIFFSAPEGQELSNAAPSLAPRAPDLSAFTPPPSDFSFTLKAQPQPLSVPTISPAQAAQLQQAQNRERNWTLMTPAEIMDVPTPEKILGLSERDASGRLKNQTAAERFLERQQDNERTNAFAAYNSSVWNPAQDERPDLSGPKKEVQAFSSPLSFEMPMQQNPDATQSSGWSKPFSSTPTVTQAQTPEQLAAAAEFQKLIEPHGATPATPSVQAAAGNFSSPFQSAPNSIMAQPSVNSAGTPFGQVSGVVNAPKGVTQAVGLTGEKISSPASVEPEWKPQLPPWMASEPQPGTIPQRKF